MEDPKVTRIGTLQEDGHQFTHVDWQDGDDSSCTGPIVVSNDAALIVPVITQVPLRHCKARRVQKISKPAARLATARRSTRPKPAKTLDQAHPLEVEEEVVDITPTALASLKECVVSQNKIPRQNIV